ncbi:MAG: bifunctional shikimate kinase/3-dehydroquinate synthase [Solirubrobacteraceae bacterium]
MEQLAGVQVSAGTAGGARRVLVFIGFMGAGKSTAARLAAEALGVEALDSDALLEERLGHSIAEEFQRRGEGSFRAAEEQVVCELLERAAAGSVIALGGGSVLSAKVREALAPHTTVLLDIDGETAWRRATSKHHDPQLERPLASNREQFVALYRERAELYGTLADAILPATPRETLTDALAALRALAQAPVQTKLLWASAASGSYPVFCGQGLLQSGFWPFEPARRFAVSDLTVAQLYLQHIKEVSAAITIDPGERSKTLASAQRIWSELVSAGMTRADQVVALGGGVVGDLAGFCAATYQRGVPIVHIPTTLVAQVDSAYGGKTGVDLPQAKNYVGAYHQPAGVLVDPGTLQTLPTAEFAAGWVEVLKTALIAGERLWERLAADEPIDQQIILDCARTKLRIVAADERDGGIRQVLNLGHTVGHALEVATGYERLRHGEAVGLGLLAALRLSGTSKLRDQVQALLSAHNLPVSIQGIGVQEVIAALALDKKRTGTHVPFVLVHAPGDVRPGGEVDEQDLQSAINELIET